MQNNIELEVFRERAGISLQDAPEATISPDFQRREHSATGQQSTFPQPAILDYFGQTSSQIENNFNQSRIPGDLIHDPNDMFYAGHPQRSLFLSMANDPSSVDPQMLNEANSTSSPRISGETEVLSNLSGAHDGTSRGKGSSTFSGDSYLHGEKPSIPSVSESGDNTQSPDTLEKPSILPGIHRDTGLTEDEGITAIATSLQDTGVDDTDSHNSDPELSVRITSNLGSHISPQTQESEPTSASQAKGRAPWAIPDGNFQHQKPQVPGFRQIQQSEMKKEEEKKAAVRKQRTVSRPAALVQQPVEEVIVGAWGLPTSQAGSRAPKEKEVPASPVPAMPGPVWTNVIRPQTEKKSMKEILEEEKKRQTTTRDKEVANANAKRAYAESASKVGISLYFIGHHSSPI
jgi:hypothetical protein